MSIVNTLALESNRQIIENYICLFDYLFISS